MCHFHNKISYICINMYLAYITKIYKCFSKGYLFFHRKVITISTKKIIQLLLILYTLEAACKTIMLNRLPIFLCIKINILINYIYYVIKKTCTYLFK